MRRVSTALAAIAALAGCSGSGTTDYDRQDAADGASFRLEARETIGRLKPVCPYSVDPAQLARYEEPRARYEALKEWVADTPFIIDLAVIEADYNQFWSDNTTECGPADTEESIGTLNAELEALNARLDNLEKLAGVI